ncbi:response regulator transcription factor [Nocardioides rubriscoriae]|uniref:response regulator transcription factor n=1 Tax=Nocardioides rubriscoriae TaxID=642762 RepID=UPI0011DFFD11|nr:response regulator transcription factor [Nocardioides rubriscoriae]
MAGSRVRVAIVDDYEIVVAGLAALLSPFADRVEVVELDSNVPVISDVDVVLYDSFAQVQGPDIDLDDLVGGGPAKVVVFSWNTSPDLVRQTFDAGVHGYVSKGVTPQGLVDALLRVHAGERVAPEPDPPARDDVGAWPGADVGLSGRESEVLALICQGLSNDEIAERLFVTVNTVKTYIRTCYRKIDVDTRTKAVLWGLEHGFRPDRSRTVT